MGVNTKAKLVLGETIIIFMTIRAIKQQSVIPITKHKVQDGGHPPF